MVQLTAQEQVVHAALSRSHARTGAAALIVAVQRRCVAHEVEALEQRLRRGERDAGGAQGVNDEEADVGRFRLQALHCLARAIEHHQLQRYLRAVGQRSGRVHRDAT